MAFDLECLLRLFAVPGVGPTRLRALIGKFKSPEEVFRASSKDLITVDGIDQRTAQTIKTATDNGFAKEQLSRLNKSEAKIVTFWDEEFPENLKKIYDPPALLFVRGQLKPEDKWAVSIVGTRTPTAYGKVVTEKLSSELARKGMTIVSGFARGIDTLAHGAALKAGGRTIAVFGCGVDVIYPWENRRLVDKIIANGALVSEFPMGSGPEAPNFPRRNRIICGLSLGTVVVEAGEKSGARITADIALEQNREVFAVPGNINNPKSQGTNQLIKEGAKLIQSADDIIEELKPQLTSFLRKDRSLEPKISLTGPEKALLEKLSNEPIHIDKIAQLNEISTSQALALLLSLELKDLIKQLPGKMFVRL